MPPAFASPRSWRPLLVALVVGSLAAVVLAVSAGGVRYRAEDTPGALATRAMEAVDGNDLKVDGPVPAITPMDLLTEAGFVQTQSVSAMAQRMHVTWPSIAGQPELDAQLRGTAQRMADGFARDHAPEAGERPGAVPELNARWLSVGASPTVVGLLSDEVLNLGGADSASWRTTWYSLADRRVLRSVDLISDVPTFLRLVREELKRAVPDATFAGVTLAGLPVLAFTREGRLLVGLDQRQTPVQNRRISVALTKAQTDQLLSARGRLAQRAATSPSVPVSAVTGTTAAPIPRASAMGGKVDCSKQRCVALTFDDGPGPQTNALLGMLASKQAPATFFVLGSQVETHPNELRAEVAAGHEIGIHTWDHRDLTKLPTSETRSEIDSTLALVEKTAGVRPTLLRPPYGATNKVVSASARASGLSQILWDVDTRDWVTHSGSASRRAVARGIVPGSIILMHDIQPSTIGAAEDIIDLVRRWGYTPVTVSDLLGSVRPGEQYRSAADADAPASAGPASQTPSRAPSWVRTRKPVALRVVAMPDTPNEHQESSPGAAMDGFGVTPGAGGVRTIRAPWQVSSIPRVRAALTADLAERGIPETTIAEAAMVVTELVSNALRHAQALVDHTVRVHWLTRGATVELEVSDGGSETLPIPAPYQPSAATGRGLRIVRSLAHEWGVIDEERGRTVWASLGGPSRRRVAK